MPIHTILKSLCASGFCKRGREPATLPSFHRREKQGFSPNSRRETKRIVLSAHPLGKQEYYPTSKRGWTSLSDKVIRQEFSRLVFEIQGCYQDSSTRNQMGKIRYLLFSSMLKTLAHRHKTKTSFACCAKQAKSNPKARVRYKGYPPNWSACNSIG